MLAIACQYYDVRSWLSYEYSQLSRPTTITRTHAHTLHTQIADKVGLMRLPEFNGSLVIFINGEAIGIVATGIPEKMYGFIELQNDCERICITRCHGVKMVSDNLGYIIPT